MTKDLGGLGHGCGYAGGGGGGVAAGGGGGVLSEKPQKAPKGPNVN